tara:strand:+ start:576 stop:734 length:159 start_codon:yes stop_codon:yes gene_type:complete
MPVLATHAKLLKEARFVFFRRFLKGPISAGKKGAYRRCASGEHKGKDLRHPP